MAVDGFMLVGLLVTTYGWDPYSNFVFFKASLIFCYPPSTKTGTFLPDDDSVV
jgi:hypothetical protein